MVFIFHERVEIFPVAVARLELVVLRFVFVVARFPERVAMFPVAVAMLLLIVTSWPVIVATLVLSVLI
jgi:hypothetical protein